ncbi:MAG TPA: peptide chain release factor 1 [Actinomycetota bacterium]|nr:peptide chain release factor 1 [Actinomycetota bacterium]
MLDKLAAIEARFSEIERQLSDSAVASDPDKLRTLGKEHSELEPIVAASREYRGALDDLAAAKEMLRDSSADPYLRAEVDQTEERIEKLEQQLKDLLVPKDPNDARDVIVEIRAAAGGDEAGLFARDLYEMYSRYAEGRRWKIEMLSGSESDRGGFKEVSFAVKGKGAWSRLKHESGVHRVQRVPATESQGRIHTSTATVAVLPEAEDVDIDINPSDLKIDVYRSSGPGGQSVNTTDSAVRITHVPTGEVVACQEERSQLQNKERAMRLLRARLLARAIEEARAEYEASRKAAVGTGDRSEKIRTYNFPQNRVTDHRIGLSLQKLPQVMAGDIDELVDALIAKDRADRLESNGDD